MKTQVQIIIEVLKKNNGYAELNKIYKDVFLIKDTSFKKDSKYKEIIRGYLQTRKEFFRVKPGIWALEESREKLPQEIKEIIQEDTESYFQRPTTHAKIQRDIIFIGKELKYITYIPSQDKTKVYDENNKLKDIVDIYKIPLFTYKIICNEVRSIDVIWFKEEIINGIKTLFPKNVFEIETSTRFTRSLDKFKLLLNFNIQYFYIISPKEKEKTFNNIIFRDEYLLIRDKVRFLAFEDVESLTDNPNLLNRFEK